MYVCLRAVTTNSASNAVHGAHCRIGRSGRFGRKGVAINFVKQDDIRVLRDIEQYYSTQIDEVSGSEQCADEARQPGQPSKAALQEADVPRHSARSEHSCGLLVVLGALLHAQKKENMGISPSRAPGEL